MIDGVPFPSHMGISDHWMIHYLNAGMTRSADKRAEEAQFMDEFETGFRRRHEATLRDVWKRLGLEYFALDCAELADGRLLVLEIDVAMIVHKMDPPDMFRTARPHAEAIPGLPGDASARGPSLKKTGAEKETGRRAAGPFVAR